MSYDENHEKEVTYFARTNFRNQMIKFGIRTDDRRRHMYVIGKTGMGKTVLLENMFLSDIYAGHGCCYVDPHGDTAEKLIDFIPSHRINDVVYFNPSDIDYPIGFNILEAVDERHKSLVASGMMSVFKKIWEDQWSSRMEYILNNTILALLDNPGSTLLGINRLLSDADYRKRIVGNVKDPIVKQFWLKEFASYNEKYAQEAVAPIQNKIGQFLSSAVIRNIVAQVKSTIDVRGMMDHGKIFIINLSKGRIGEDSMRLMGGLLITKMQLAAMERVDIPESERKDFYLYVDEFQNFAVESFASILSEARKYHLCLIMAHQYIMQLTDVVREAVFGNMGTIITFRVGAPDAQYMETEFGPRFLPEDLINIPKFNVYLKLLIDGVTSQPFSATTLPPIAERMHSEEKVIRVSHERYSTPRAEIEDKILKWSGMDDVNIDDALQEAEEKKKSVKDSRKPRHEYVCTECGTQIVLPVELDRSRPIYCDDCIEKIRERRRGGGGRGPGTGGDRRPMTPSSSQPPRSEVKVTEGEFVQKISQEPAISLSVLASRADVKPPEDFRPRSENREEERTQEKEPVKEIKERPAAPVSTPASKTAQTPSPRPSQNSGASFRGGDRRRDDRPRDRRPDGHPSSVRGDRQGRTSTLSRVSSPTSGSASGGRPSSPRPVATPPPAPQPVKELSLSALIPPAPKPTTPLSGNIPPGKSVLFE